MNYSQSWPSNFVVGGGRNRQIGIRVVYVSYAS